MRISEPLNRSGYFWVPSHPATKLPGVLSIADGGEIELEILGNFDPPSEQSLVHDIHPVDRVVGELEKDGLVTLDDCHYKTKSLGVFGGVSKSTLSASRLVIGCAFEEDEPLNFNSFRFSVDGLEEWIRMNAIQVNYHSATNGATIKFDLPKDIDVCRVCKHDMVIALSFGGALPGTEIHKASVRLDAYVQLTSESLQSIENFVEVAYRIVSFLRLAMNREVSFKDAYVARYDIVHEIGDEKRPRRQLRFVYPSLPFSIRPPEISAHAFLFSYPDIIDRFGTMLVSWIDAYENLGPVLGLYLAATSGKFHYLDERFLTLARGLETLHRRRNPQAERLPKIQYADLKKLLLSECPPEHENWLSQRLHFANEPALADRLRELVAPFESWFQRASDVDLLIKRTVRTRNYLTHFDSDSEKKAARGVALWNICNRLEAMLCLQLLMHLGMSNEDLLRILNQHNNLRRKFDSSPIE